jgi:uncharacterized paraquat-inducible protein A
MADSGPQPITAHRLKLAGHSHRCGKCPDHQRHRKHQSRCIFSAMKSAANRVYLWVNILPCGSVLDRVGF